MAEYKAHTGWRVIVVFDAHLVPGIEKKKRQHDVEVVFTRKNETADERIEKLVSELSGQTCANSCSYIRFDRTMGYICAWGTYENQLRELEIEMKEINRNISKKVKTFQEQQTRFKDSFN